MDCGGFLRGGLGADGGGGDGWTMRVYGGGMEVYSTGAWVWGIEVCMYCTPYMEMRYAITVQNPTRRLLHATPLHAMG